MGAQEMGKMLLEYDRGNYNDVIKEGRVLLSENNLDSGEEINIRTYIAFSAVAIGDTIMAIEEFNKILDIDPNFSLNPDFVSPKIMSVFNNVKSNRKIVVATTQKDSIDTQKEVVVIQSRSNKFIKAFAKSAVFPGWGQLSKGEFDKALILSSAFWVSMGIESYLWYKTDDLKQEYDRSQTPSEAISLYDDYDLFSRMQQGMMGICMGIWVYNVLDALFE